MLTPIRGLLFIIGFLLVMTSCSYKQNQLLFADHKTVTDTTSKYFTNPTAAYRLQPQDVLQIRNLQNRHLIAGEEVASPTAGSGGGSGAASESSTFQIEDDSTVALPVIGRVKVGGLTRPEATKLIEGLYRKSLLVNPIIDLKITNLKVTLLGEVSKQGNYALVKDHTSLTEILGEAGGLSDKANETTVKIIRGTGPGQQVACVNLRDINSLSRPDIILQNNDIVYVAQNHRAIRNDKIQNLSTIIQPALILLNTALIIFTLIHR